MRLTAQAIADQMARSGDVTKKGLDRIKNLFRTADLISPSKKQAEGFGREWAKGMDHTKEVTSKGIAAMITEAKKLPGPMREIALETWLDQAKAAQRSGDLTTEAFRKMRSRVFAEFGQVQASGKTFNKEFAKGFVDMVNNSGGAMGIMMENVSNLLGTLGGKGKLNWKILNAKLSKDPNGASLGRQKGGPVPAGLALGGLAATVPGTSTGDRHTLALGGVPVAKVESGEGIFVGNRKMMGAAKAANDAVPRFQTGGLVRGGFAEPELEGEGGGLKRLGQAAISKVYEGAKSYLGKHKAPAAGGSIADAGPLKRFNHRFPKHSLFELDGKTRFSEALVARIAAWAGLPGRLFGQIAHGESNFYPGIYGVDPGGTIGRGLWAITSGVGNDEMIARYGGPPQMFNPLVNAQVAKEIYDGAGQSISPWYGTKYVTGMKSGGLLKKAMRGGPLGRVVQLLAGGGMVDVPGDGGTGVVNPSIVDLVSAYCKRFDTDVNYGYDPSGHVSPGHLVTGTATDVSPTDGNWDGAFAKGLETLASVGFEVGYDGSIPGTENWPDHGRGNHAHIEWVGNGTASDARQRLREALGGLVGSGSSIKPEEGLGGAAAAEKKPAEKVPPNFGGVSTQPLSFGQPKTLEQVEAELRKLVGDDGKSGLARQYRKAAKKAEKESKPETAKALRKNLHIIEQRVAGLRSMRTTLRMSKAKKALAEGIRKKLSKIAGYDQRIEGTQRSYEVAAQFAEQVVGLEPESPEIAPEPEVSEQAPGESDKAYEKRRRDAHNAYEQQREGTEKDYVARYSAYIEGNERPAYQGVLERVANWRNTILRAETFGFGGDEPSANAIEQTWAGGVRKADHEIDGINDFTQKVKERVEDYRDKVKREVSDWRHDHPDAKDLPKWLRERQEHLPDDLQKQVDERDRLRSNLLPRLVDKDSQLRTAIGEARESFFAGGDNRLGPNGAGIKDSNFAKKATIPALPLPGSGSFEERLQDVQGIHIFPEQHELLAAGDLAGPNQAGRFGGVIWDVRESIKELGLKIKQATGSVSKAQIEKPEDEKADDSERVALLEGLLREANQRTLVSDTLRDTIAKFNVSYPFAGTFHTGGVVPGPSSAEAMALVRGGETVFTPEQMQALGSSSAGGFNIEKLAIYDNGDGTATIDIDGQQFRRRVEEINRSTSPRGRSAVR